MMVSVFTERVERTHHEKMIDVCVMVYLCMDHLVALPAEIGLPAVSSEEGCYG